MPQSLEDTPVSRVWKQLLGSLSLHSVFTPQSQRGCSGVSSGWLMQSCGCSQPFTLCLEHAVHRRRPVKMSGKVPGSWVNTPSTSLKSDYYR
jgi:hypothetical protein